MLADDQVVFHRGGLVYAERAGGWVHVSEVANGLACGCVCEECRSPLVARNRGRVRMAHFAHAAGRQCGNTGEAGLARCAARILSERPELLLPLCEDSRGRRVDRVIAADAVEVRVERGKVPEVRVRLKDRILRVFIRPGDRLPRGLSAAIEAEGISAMQLTVAPDSDGLIRAGQLARALRGEEARRAWVLNARERLEPPPALHETAVQEPARHGIAVQEPPAPAPLRAGPEPGVHFCWRCGRTRPFEPHGEVVRCTRCGAEFWL